MPVAGYPATRHKRIDSTRELAETIIQIPIISVTAHGDVPMAVRAIKAGAVEFLTKPFRHQDLPDAVQQALKRDCVRGSNLVSFTKVSVAKVDTSAQAHSRFGRFPRVALTYAGVELLALVPSWEEFVPKTELGEKNAYPH